MANAIISQLEVNTTPSVTMQISFLEVNPSVLASRNGISNKTFPKLSGTSRGTIIAPKVVITFLEINPIALTGRIGTSNKTLSRLIGTSRGTNVTTTNVPRMIISFLEIEATALAAIIGSSNKSLPKLNGVSRGTLVVDQPRIIISFLEVNAATQATRVGNSNKTIPRITGNASGTNTAGIVGPVITNISPPNGTILKGKGKATISATVTDRFYSIIKVETFLNNTLVATDGTVPYSYIWNLRNYPRGVYIITIKATNSAGVSSTATSRVTLT